MIQQTLFEPKLKYQAHSETSRAAAEKIEPSGRSAVIWEAIQEPHA